MSPALTAFLVCLGAVLVALFFARMGMKSGAFIALARMLATLLSLFIALRYWFPASRWLSEHQTAPDPKIAVAAFWAIFLVAVVIITKLRKDTIETFESVFPSAMDNVLGALFGMVSGAVVATALMMTLTIAAPQVWPDYKPDALPLPVDHAPLVAYRFVETRVAGIAERSAAHTLLPALKETGQQSHKSFWR